MKKANAAFVFLLSLYSYSQVGISTTNPDGALDIVANNDNLLITCEALTSTTVSELLISITR